MACAVEGHRDRLELLLTAFAKLTDGPNWARAVKQPAFLRMEKSPGICRVARGMRALRFASSRTGATSRADFPKAHLVTSFFGREVELLPDFIVTRFGYTGCKRLRT
jgi:hypothetical protein